MESDFEPLWKKGDLVEYYSKASGLSTHMIGDFAIGMHSSGRHIMCLELIDQRNMESTYYPMWLIQEAWDKDWLYPLQHAFTHFMLRNIRSLQSDIVQRDRYRWCCHSDLPPRALLSHSFSSDLLEVVL